MALYDQFGRKVDISALQNTLAEPTITGVRQTWHASAADGLTPYALASLIREANDNNGLAYLTLAEEMEEREPHYRSVLSTRKMAICGLQPNIESPTNEKLDEKITDFLTGLIHTSAFAEGIEDLVDALGKGYSVCEIIWDRTGAQWVPSEYRWRDPRYFRFDADFGQEIRLIDEKDQSRGIPLAPYKFLTHRPKLKSGLTLRSGLARVAAAQYMCKSYSVRDWMAFGEVFGMPIRIGKYPNSATQEQINKLASAVANIGHDAAATMPETMMIEFQDATKSAGGENLFATMAKFFDSQMSKAVLGQTMTTDDGSSQSQATVHNEVRGDILRSDAKQLARTINRDLIRPLVDLNFGPQKLYPQICIAPEEAEDLEALAKSLPVFIDRGLRVEESVIRDKFKLPEPAPDAILLGLPKPPEPVVDNNALPDEKKPQGRGDPAKEDAQATMQRMIVALNTRGNTDQIDLLQKDALTDWEKIMEPVISPITDLASQSATYDEFVRGLNSILEETMDPAELVRSLALACFKARSIGDVTDES